MKDAPAPAAAPTEAEYAAQLAQAQRELQTLIYAVSHDLRAPVRAITGFSQALKEHTAGVLDTTATHYLQRIEQSTQRLGAMIDGLLSLSRLAQADMHLIVVDVSQLCEGIAQELASRYPQQHPQMRIAASIKAWCDPHLLRIALQELLDNAWKFSQNRSDAQISVDASTDNGRVTLCIRDNGCGIDMQYADRLFVPFQHLQTRSELNGLGLGLARVQRIVNQHGGKLWVEGAPQNGAAFYFTLRQPD